MTRTGTSVYPASFDAFDRIGTANYEDEVGYDIVNVENEAMDALEKMQVVMGTTSGTSLLTNAVTLSGTQTLTNKTINGAIVGTSAFTGGTASTITLTSPKINENVALTATSTQLDALVSLGTASKSKVYSTTRNMAGTTGDVAYTTIGFKPTSIIAYGHIEGSAYCSSRGFSDNGSVSYCEYLYTAGESYLDASLVEIATASLTYQKATIKSYDSDGFTLSWVKSGTATGTATLQFLCLR